MSNFNNGLNNEEKILRFFGDLFKENHEKIDHAVDLKTQDLLMDVTRKANDRMEDIKKDLASYVESLKTDLKNTRDRLLAELVEQSSAQAKRSKLWFWNK